MCLYDLQTQIIITSAKLGILKLNCSWSPICRKKPLNWLISSDSEVLIKEHWHLACMNLVTSTIIGTMLWPWPFIYFKVKFVAALGTTIFRICLCWHKLIVMCLLSRRVKLTVKLNILDSKIIQSIPANFSNTNSKKEGLIALHMSVCLSIYPSLGQYVCLHTLTLCNW